jgi:RNA-directed DNA polymerase
VFYETDAGTPPGGVISPILANLTLDGLEKEMRQAFPKGRGTRKVNLVRFADDFIVSADEHSLLTTKVSPIVENFVGKRGLSLSKEKTHITHIQLGFDFLGFNVRKYKGKLLIKPSKKNVKAVLTKIRGIIKGNKQTTSSELIRKLNPIIRGWSYNFRHVVSKKTFKSVDNAIFKTIWRWCCRRHPNKGKRWIKEKYFKTIGNRNWVFYGIILVRGKEQEITLFSASRVPIKRHIKVRSAANPYDPEWEKYYEKRQGYKMANSPKGTKLLRNHRIRQDGKCPKCHQFITVQTGWNIHRIIPGSEGGTYQSTNLLLLHPICHQQLHYQDNSSNAACS